MYLNETLETDITRPKYIGKNITLYHCSIECFNRVEPRGINIGTRLSKQRMSSFWIDDKEAAINYAAMLLINHSKIGFASIDLKNGGVYCDIEFKSQVIDYMKKNKIYLYQKTLPSKHVGRGHNKELGEFTIDFPVIPEIRSELKGSELLQRVKFVPKAEIDKYIETFGKDSYMYASLIDNIVYHTTKKTREKRKEYRELSKIDRVTILSSVKALNLPKGEYWLSYKAALVVYGIFETTNDIDLLITNKLSNILEKQGYEKIDPPINNGSKKIIINDNIECFDNTNRNRKYNEVNGVCVDTIEGIYQLYKDMNREKDQMTIKKIEEYLNRKKA